MEKITLAVINGHEVYKFKNTKGFYFVTVRSLGNGLGTYVQFRTKKEALQYAESLNPV